MAESYRKIDKEYEFLPANEIRVNRTVEIGRYLKRALDLFYNPAADDSATVIIKSLP